jgi:hypothetical protein
MPARDVSRTGTTALSLLRISRRTRIVAVRILLRDHAVLPVDGVLGLETDLPELFLIVAEAAQAADTPVAILVARGSRSSRRWLATRSHIRIFCRSWARTPGTPRQSRRSRRRTSHAPPTPRFARWTRIFPRPSGPPHSTRTLLPARDGGARSWPPSLGGHRRHTSAST